MAKIPGFLRLPIELRLQIYQYLILPDGESVRRIWVDSMLKSPIRRLPCSPDLAISQTCRQLHREFFDYFYTKTQLVISVLPSNAFIGGSAAARMPILLENELKLSKIREIVLLILLEELDSGSYIDMAILMEKFPSLRRLRVAFVFQERMYIRKDNAGLWRMSASLQGLVCHIVQTVSKGVQLDWIHGGGQADELRGRKWAMGSCAYIPSATLAEIATMFEPLRGTLAG